MADKLAQNGIKKVSDLAKVNIVDVFFDSHLSGQSSWEWLNALHYLAVTTLKSIDVNKLSPTAWSSSHAPVVRPTNVTEKIPSAVHAPAPVPKPSTAEFVPPGRGLFSPLKSEEKMEKPVTFSTSPKIEPIVPPEALERRVSKEELKQQKEQLVHIPTGKALHDVVDPASLSEMKSHLKATIPPSAPTLKSPRLAPLASTQLEATKNSMSPKLEPQATWQPKSEVPSWGNASPNQPSLWGTTATGTTGTLWDAGSGTATSANPSAQHWASNVNKNPPTMFGSNTGSNTPGNNPLGSPKIMRI